MKKTDMKLHSLCSIFPEMSKEEFDDLVKDMKENGFAKGKEIITLDDQILEGRNRFNAAIAAKVEPQFRKFTGKDPAEFVIRENLIRRNLTAGQRSMIAVDIAELSKAKTSTEKAAKTMNVSRESVQVAKRVKKLSPKLAKEVKAGKVSLNAAEKKVVKPKPGNDKPRKEIFAYGNSPAATISLPVQSDLEDTSKDEGKPKDKRIPAQIAHDAFIGKMGEGLSWEDTAAKEKAAWITVADTMHNLKC